MKSYTLVILNNKKMNNTTRATYDILPEDSSGDDYTVWVWECHLSSVWQSIRFVIGSALVQIQEVAPLLYEK